MGVQRVDGLVGILSGVAAVHGLEHAIVEGLQSHGDPVRAEVPHHLDSVRTLRAQQVLGVHIIGDLCAAGHVHMLSEYIVKAAEGARAQEARRSAGDEHAAGLQLADTDLLLPQL